VVGGGVGVKGGRQKHKWEIFGCSVWAKSVFINHLEHGANLQRETGAMRQENTAARVRKAGKGERVLYKALDGDGTIKQDGGLRYHRPSGNYLL